MSFQILVVCSANVCRSPLAAVILEKAVDEAGLNREMSVLPCGESASSGLPMCAEMAEIARSLHVSQKALELHRSRTLRPAMIEQANLVLTADRTVRASVLRLVPTAHDRTFTLRQATELAVESMEANHRPETFDAGGRLRWFVTAMNSRRGLIDVPQVQRRRLARQPWKHVSVHEYDVPDAHQVVKGLHRTTAELLIPSTQTLARCLIDVARLR